MNVSNISLISAKTSIKSVTSEAKEIRKIERHKLDNARKLRGKVMFDKSHQLGEEKPVAPVAPQVQLPDNRLELADRDMYDFFGLHRYRTHILRKESRHLHLAYGFLRGVPYNLVENKPGKEPVSIYQLEDMVFNYAFQGRFDISPKEEDKLMEDFTRWVDSIPNKTFN